MRSCVHSFWVRIYYIYIQNVGDGDIIFIFFWNMAGLLHVARRLPLEPTLA